MPLDVAANIIRKLQELSDQFDQLSAQLLEPAVLGDHRQVRAISIKRAALQPLASAFRRYRQTARQIDELEAVVEEDTDAELVAIATEELPALREQAAMLIASAQQQLLTADDRAVGSVILEVRAGVGGDEAAIWAGDLLAMYQRFAAGEGWSVETMQLTAGDAGGYKNAMLRIGGEGVWSDLGYEGGTHQVKRVPATEAQGRVHTSTATVAVLAEPEEVEVRIDPSEIKEIMTTAQGPGGQNVNKVATAVHLIHIPTGIEVRMQETKSQSQNREKAWQLLRARLYERQRAEQHAHRAETRASMIGSGDRAEKIRTYRYKENLLVDHRVEESFNLSEIMAGRLRPLIEALARRDMAQRLAAM